MTPAQCRAARGLLDWTQPQLAAAAEVHAKTVSQFELEGVTPRRASLRVMLDAFKAAGVIFVDETPGAGPGVLLRKGLR
jgi:transcriptional regulator with XRE-family HTH domain